MTSKLDLRSITADALADPQRREEVLKRIERWEQRVAEFQRIAAPYFECLDKHGIEYRGNPLEREVLSEERERQLAQCIEHSYLLLKSVEAKRYVLLQLGKLQSISLDGRKWLKEYDECNDFGIRFHLATGVLGGQLVHGDGILLRGLCTDALRWAEDTAAELLERKIDLCKGIALSHYAADGPELGLAIAARLQEFGVAGVRALRYCGRAEVFPMLEKYSIEQSDPKVAKAVENTLKQLRKDLKMRTKSGN